MSGVLKDTGCQPQSHGQSEPGGGPCPRCQRPRCSAAAKIRPGERCRKNPHPGATICTNHGLTEVGRAKAAQVVQEQAADAEIRKLWVGLDQATPVQDPVASMARLAGALEQLLDEVGVKVEAVKTVAAGENLAQVRGELVYLERVAALLARLLDSMARLGIAERQVQLQQDQAELVTTAFRGAIAVLGALLTPADKDLVVRTFLNLLGRGPEAIEAAS